MPVLHLMPSISSGFGRSESSLMTSISSGFGRSESSSSRKAASWAFANSLSFILLSINCLPFLYVEPEQRDVPVLHYVVLALAAH